MPVDYIEQEQTEDYKERMSESYGNRQLREKFKEKVSLFPLSHKSRAFIQKICPMRELGASDI